MTGVYGADYREKCRVMNRNAQKRDGKRMYGM